jgi:tetratricopeptide (TPR) repeat protein
MEPPRFWVAHVCLVKSYEKQGQYSEALAACDKAWELSGGNSEALSWAGYVHAVAGSKPMAEARIQELLAREKECYVPPYNLALVFAGLGETETALPWLDQAFEDRDVHMTFLLDHKWDEMRANTQFQAILERVGLVRS